MIPVLFVSGKRQTLHQKKRGRYEQARQTIKVVKPFMIQGIRKAEER